MLDQELTYIKGVGPKKAEVLAAHGLNCVRDLLEYYPRRYLDRTSVTPVAEIRQETGEITVVGRVIEAGVKGYRRKARFEAQLYDGSGMLGLVWFRRVPWIRNFIRKGEVIAASAKPGFYRGWQMQHPAVEKLNLDPEELETPPAAPDGGEDDADSTAFSYRGQIVPIYPGTEELRKAWLDSRAISRILGNLYKRWVVEPDEFLPGEVLERHHLVSLARALRDVHLGRSMEDVERARRRLKFQELFLLELMLAFRKTARDREDKGLSFTRTGEDVRRLKELLPFELTEAQKRVLREIHADMRCPRPMNRLLQGDVGSGKTLVALFAMLIAAANGCQAALMAPTEILAEQHFRSITAYTDKLGLRVTLLTGSRKGETRRRALEEIAGGWAQIVVGTHALFQEAVGFAGLGLVVIDEQHRFGVMQRANLRRKGVHLDTLVMTATPIPRTLAIVTYGDMELSVLDELPPGRLPVKTVWRREGVRDEVFAFLKKQVLELGAQAYVVYPLVEESEKLDLRAAEEAREELEQGPLAGCRLGLLHGRMKAEEKDRVLQAFFGGEIQVLISTTVIEVGMDNPRATIMVVEQAERFGLSQLHQLRGRVGRGSARSYCILLAGRGLSEEGRERLETLASSNDGFEIAETDLRMRGTGDFFGTRQSGLPELKIADIIRDLDLLVQARDTAFSLVERDPRLEAHPRLRAYLLRRHAEEMSRVED